MTAALLMLAALSLDGVFGELPRRHPLVGFGAYARGLEERMHDSCASGVIALRWRGMLALALAVVPPVVLCALAITVVSFAAPLEIAVLYFALGHRSLREHALRVRDALQRSDLGEARRCVALMVSRDTADMDASRVAAATVESVLENGNDAVFAALFWFAVAGAPGALLYRLVNTLDAMWGYRTPRYLHFGRAAARLDDAMNYIPARLTALTYALIGRTRDALRCWRIQAGAWESPNAGPVMAAGAGSLGVILGGGAFYHGQWKARPALGEGAVPQAGDIVRALRLVAAGIGIWIAFAIATGAACHA
jgi:adenosylcobinamide-phosphate synthase